MSVKVIGFVTAIFGLGIITISALVLYDAINHKNREWEIQNSPYIKYGYDVFWDQFKFDDDILIILTPLSLLVGLVQFLLPALFCCLQPKDLKRMMQLWIGALSILLFMTGACFTLALFYGVDTIGIKTYHYDGRYSNTYLSSWWKYDKGQAYLGLLGCNLVILLLVIVWMVRWNRAYQAQPSHNRRNPNMN